MYMGYPLDSLLFDAKRGSTTSTHLILEYFCSQVQSKNDIPPEILEFLSSNIEKVLTEEISGNEMFNPKGTKITPWTGLVGDYMTEYEKVHTSL